MSATATTANTIFRIDTTSLEHEKAATQMCRGLQSSGQPAERVDTIEGARELSTKRALPKTELLGHLDLDDLPVLHDEKDRSELDAPQDLRDLEEHGSLLLSQVLYALDRMSILRRHERTVSQMQRRGRNEPTTFSTRT
jgi:hypothetical protein